MSGRVLSSARRRRNFIAKANRDKLAVSGMKRIEAYDQMENIADLAMPTDNNRIATFERNRRKKPRDFNAKSGVVRWGRSHLLRVQWGAGMGKDVRCNSLV